MINVCASLTNIIDMKSQFFSFNDLIEFKNWLDESDNKFKTLVVDIDKKKGENKNV